VRDVIQYSRCSATLAFFRTCSAVSVVAAVLLSEQETRQETRRATERQPCSWDLQHHGDAQRNRQDSEEAPTAALSLGKRPSVILPDAYECSIHPCCSSVQKVYRADWQRREFIGHSIHALAAAAQEPFWNTRLARVWKRLKSRYSSFTASIAAPLVDSVPHIPNIAARVLAPTQAAQFCSFTPGKTASLPRGQAPRQGISSAARSRSAAA
jgi:hypothetical protein